jgi:hypothetical protein
MAMMTITYEARCKDCRFCGYYNPLKKDGTESRITRHKCAITNKQVCKRDLVCDKWIINYSGIPYSFTHIERSYTIPQQTFTSIN